MEAPGDPGGNHGPMETDKQGIPVWDLFGGSEDHHLKRGIILAIH
jgi:hypothetical protein